MTAGEHDQEAARLAERYRRLAEVVVQREATDGGPHGAHARAAELLGISRSYLSKILNRKRSAGFKSAERASRRLDVPMRYFTDAEPAFDPVSSPIRVPAPNVQLDMESVHAIQTIRTARQLLTRELQGAVITREEVEAFLDALGEITFVRAACKAEGANGQERYELGRMAYWSLARLATSPAPDDS